MGDGRTDRQTDRQTDASTIAKTRVKNHVPFEISIASTRSYVLSLAHGKNLVRSRSSRFSLATARSRSRLRV